MLKNLLLSLLIVLLLTACGSQATSPADTAPAPSQTEEPAAVAETAAEPPEPTLAPTEPPTEPTVEQPAPAGISFANDVFPIIDSRCINCHGGEDVEEGLDMSSYASLMAGSSNGPVVIPGNAASSLFVTLVQENEMPKRGPKLLPAQVQIFVDWVNQGALDN